MNWGERYIWAALVVVSMIWGILSGISFSVPGFWLYPPTAIFGVFALAGVYVGVMLVYARVVEKSATDIEAYIDAKHCSAYCDLPKNHSGPHHWEEVDD